MRLGFRGNIKTTIYFLQVARNTPHSTVAAQFLHHQNNRSKKQEHNLAIFLKPAAWDAIDGETTPATSGALAAAAPGVFRVQQCNLVLIVLDYQEWKARVLRVQKAMRA